MSHHLVTDLIELGAKLDNLMKYVSYVVDLGTNGNDRGVLASIALQANSSEDHEFGFHVLYSEFRTAVISIDEQVKLLKTTPLLVWDCVRDGEVDFPYVAASYCEATIIFAAKSIFLPLTFVGPKTWDNPKLWLLLFAMWRSRLHKEDRVPWVNQPEEFLRRVYACYHNELSKARNKLVPPAARVAGRTGMLSAGNDTMPAGDLVMDSMRRLISVDATKSSNSVYLGMIVDYDRRTVTRVNHACPPVELTQSQMRLFTLFVFAEAQGVTREQLDNLPGESSARSKAISTLRTKIYPLGLTITEGTGGKNRVLVEEPK